MVHLVPEFPLVDHVLSKLNNFKMISKHQLLIRRKKMPSSTTSEQQLDREIDHRLSLQLEGHSPDLQDQAQDLVKILSALKNQNHPQTLALEAADSSSNNKTILVQQLLNLFSTDPLNVNLKDEFP